MENKEIAAIFRDIADILEIKNENVFRIRAYRQAASRIDGLSGQLSEIYAEDPAAILAIPGIGKDLAGKIEEMVTTGHLEFYSLLVKEFPQGFLDLLNIPALGPKKLKNIRDVLGVENMDDLEKACLAGKVSELDGMGSKTQQKILDGIRRFRKYEQRMLYGEAEALAENILAHISAGGNIEKAATAGSLRRGMETVGDVDILVAARDPSKAAERFLSFPGITQVIAGGSTRCSVEVKGSRRVDLRIVDKKCFGAALLYFTGSKQHNIKIRHIAKKKKYKINEYGVFSGAGRGQEKFVAGRTEEEVYKTIGMQWIPPEIREDRGEIEAALKGQIPEGLVELGDIRGDMHLHTLDTDGRMALEELIEAALSKRYEYIAVTNHSKLIRISRGMNEKQLLKHAEDVRRISGKYKKIKVMAGVEVDILKDGTLDIKDYVLKELDIVIAAVHSNFLVESAAQTERLIKALGNRYVNMLAHPSGRLIRKRAALTFDADRVFAEAAANNVMLEINTHGERVDLNDAGCIRAKALGARFSINTDAHQRSHLDGMKLGVATARRAWLEKKDIVNTYTFAELKKALKK